MNPRTIGKLAYWRDFHTNKIERKFLGHFKCSVALYNYIDVLPKWN